MPTKRNRPAGGADRIEALDKQPASKQATVGFEILYRSDSVKEATPPGVSVLPGNHAPIPPSDARLFIDRFGRRHPVSILHNWSPAAQKAMGLRPVVDGDAPFCDDGGVRPADGVIGREGRRHGHR